MNFTDLTVAELKSLANERGLEYNDKIKKIDLIALLETNEYNTEGTETAQNAPESAQTALMVKVTTQALRIRTEPSKTAKTARIVREGATFAVTAFDDTWYKLGNGGYCIKKFTEII